MTITDFLLARIAEDENVARSAGHGNSLVFHDWNAEWVQVELPDNVRPSYDVRQIKRFSPARILAECEAKRRIVDVALDVIDSDRWGDPFADALPGVDDGQVWAFSVTLRALAAIYAGHPDYQEAWRP